MVTDIADRIDTYDDQITSGQRGIQTTITAGHEAAPEVICGSSSTRLVAYMEVRLVNLAQRHWLEFKCPLISILNDDIAQAILLRSKNVHDMTILFFLGAVY